jgi:YHS domain-containing protein
MHRNKAIALVLTMLVVLCGFFYVSDSANAVSPEIASVLSKAPASDVGKKTVCAYCGMHLTVKSDTPAATFDGKDYYFCDDMERDAFVKAPKKYLSKQPSAGIASAAKSSP